MFIIPQTPRRCNRLRRARRAGGYGQEIAPSKSAAQEGPCPAAGCARLGAAACRPPNPRKTDPQRPRSWFWGWESALFAAPGDVAQAAADREMTKMAANEKRGRRRACPAAGCARLGRGSLPPKQPPVKAADFSFTAGNLAEALNPFFIFDKIQEGKSKHRPLSCKHN